MQLVGEVLVKPAGFGEELVLASVLLVHDDASDHTLGQCGMITAKRGV
jgi:hypothetical protein